MSQSRSSSISDHGIARSRSSQFMFNRASISSQTISCGASRERRDNCFTHHPTTMRTVHISHIHSFPSSHVTFTFIFTFTITFHIHLFTFTFVRLLFIVLSFHIPHSLVSSTIAYAHVHTHTFTCDIDTHTLVVPVRARRHRCVTHRDVAARFVHTRSCSPFHLLQLPWRDYNQFT